jgi:cysteinyl-tRNA synthetase
MHGEHLVQEGGKMSKSKGDFLTVLSEVIKDSRLNNREKAHLIEDFDKVLSLNLLVEDLKESNAGMDEELINKLVKERNLARVNKNWAKADEIRDKLNKMSIEILDSKEGTIWKVKR